MDKTNLNIERYKKLTKEITPKVNDYKEVDCRMFTIEQTESGEINVESLTSLLSCLDYFVKCEYQAINYAVNRNAETLTAFTQDDLKWYVFYCIEQRVKWVRKEHPDFRPQDSLYIPAIISVICDNIGNVTCDREGIILTPSIDPLFSAEIAAHMNKDKAEGISLYMEKYIPGYQAAKGYNNKDVGCADFMLMQMIGNEIKSTRHDSHPVYALLASFVGIKLIDCSILPTQKYAEKSYLRTLMSEVTSC